MSGFTRQDLESKIKELYDVEVLPPIVPRQIDKYTLEQRWTYLEIARALAYFVVIKKNKPILEKGIAIVPFVIDEARKYFKQLERTKKQQQIESENYQKKTMTSYDIKCQHVKKTVRHQLSPIDIGAINMEDNND